LSTWQGLLINTIASLFVQLSSQQRWDEGLEEQSYLKSVKDKLTSCTMTGYTSIVFKLAYTSACPCSRDSTQTQRTQRH